MDSSSENNSSQQNTGTHVLSTIMDSITEAVHYQVLVNAFQATTVNPIVLQTLYRAKKREEIAAKES